MDVRPRVWRVGERPGEGVNKMCQMTIIDHIFIGAVCLFGIAALILICIEAHLERKAPIRLDPQTQALLRIAMKYRAKQDAEKEG